MQIICCSFSAPFCEKVVLLPRNKADANGENHKKLVQAVKGKQGSAVMGSLLKESFEG